MKNIPLVTALAVVLSASASFAQNPGAAAPQAAPAPAQAQPAPADAAPAATGLGDLDAMTFSCPKAALNAAAREASKVKSQGTYQFSFFNIVNGSHHSAYEVHFKSNYNGEPDLKYCVAMYCQQGWDPATTKTTVTLMGTTRATARMPVHGAECREPAAPARTARPAASPRVKPAVAPAVKH